MFSLPINLNTLFTFYGVKYLYKSFPVNRLSCKGFLCDRCEFQMMIINLELELFVQR